MLNGVNTRVRGASVVTVETKIIRNKDAPSLVMKEMNSLTHSCMHSLASLAIFAFSGSAVFIIRATGAKLRMLASDTRLLCLEPRCGEIDCGELRDIVSSDWLLKM